MVGRTPARLVQSRGAIDRTKQSGGLIGAFRRAEKQIAVSIECIVQRGQNLMLKVPIKINQQIATADQVDPAEGWVAQHAVAGKQDDVTQLAFDLVVLAVAVE